MTDILSNMDRDFGDQKQQQQLPTADVPRKSSRVVSATFGDGDVWQEKLMVCEAASNKLVIRSYFRSTKSGQRVWDEPPTGASHIEAASSTDRHTAEEELKTLQLAMDMNSSTNNVDDDSSSNKKNKSSKKGKGFFSAFRKKPKDKDKTSSSGGTSVFGKKKKNSSPSHPKPRAFNRPDGNDEDEDLQRAISLSMGIQPGSGGGSGGGGNDYEQHQRAEEDEALEMAKAISISEAEAAKPASAASSHHNFAEDEMLQRALEESRRETTNVAAMPPTKAIDPFGFLEDPSEASQQFQQSKSDDSDFFNQKMPAVKTDPDDDFFHQKPPAAATQPTLKSPPASSLNANENSNNAYAMFDPYANNPTSATATAASSTASLKKPPPSNDSQGLRKMEENTNGTRRSSGMGLGRRFAKKTVEDEAGVV